MKPLNKIEIFIAELTWGGVPTDVNWLRNSNLFKTKMEEFINSKLSLVEYEKYIIS